MARSNWVKTSTNPPDYKPYNDFAIHVQQSSTGNIVWLYLESEWHSLQTLIPQIPGPPGPQGLQGPPGPPGSSSSSAGPVVDLSQFDHDLWPWSEIPGQKLPITDPLNAALKAAVVAFRGNGYVFANGLLLNPFATVHGNGTILQPEKEMAEGEVLLRLDNGPDWDGINKQQAREAVIENLILDGGGKASKGTLWKSMSPANNAGIARLIRRGVGYRGAYIGADRLLEQYTLGDRETYFSCTIGMLLRSHWRWGGATDITFRSQIFDQCQVGVWLSHEGSTTEWGLPMNDIVFENSHWHQNAICNIAITGVMPGGGANVRLIGGGSEYSNWNQNSEATLSRTSSDAYDPVRFPDGPPVITVKRAGFYATAGEFYFDGFSFNDANAWKIIRLDGPDATAVLKDCKGNGTAGTNLVTCDHSDARVFIYGSLDCLGGIENVERWPDIWLRKIQPNGYDPMNYTWLMGNTYRETHNGFNNMAHPSMASDTPAFQPIGGSTASNEGSWTKLDIPDGAFAQTKWIEGGESASQNWHGQNEPIVYGFEIMSETDCVVEWKQGENSWPVIPLKLKGNRPRRFVFTHGGTNYDNYFKYLVPGGGKIYLRRFQVWHGPHWEANRMITAVMRGAI